MRTSKKEGAILTGLFVLAGLTILIAGILVLGGKNQAFSKTILLKAVFEDVNGLAKGNNVWYAGVKIGTVKQVAFTGNKVEVTFSVDESVKHLIHQDTKAKLSTDGLIGNKIILLYGGSPAVPAVTAGANLSVENVLSPEVVMNTLQDNNKNFLEITNNFKTITKGLVEGKGTVGKLLTDSSLVTSLQATMQTLNKASVNTEKITSNLAAFSGNLNRPGTLTNNLLTDTTMGASLRATIAQLNEVSVKANQVVANLNNTTGALNNTNGTVGVLFHDKEAAENLKKTLLNLQAGTQKLDENMEALQHNFLLRGYFRHRNKAAAKSQDSVSLPVTLN